MTPPYILIPCPALFLIGQWGYGRILVWFEKLTGFQESSPEQVRAQCSVEDGILRSHVNGRAYRCGWLELVSLAALRRRVVAAAISGGRLALEERVADVRDLHRDSANAGALFQVASQFNLLEMTRPEITPEQGVDRYESDPTQGPACAIAAGAGTIYRNYFVDVDGQPGQTATRQIDGLAAIGEALGNHDNRLWRMQNGYALATEEGLSEIADRLAVMSEDEIDDLRGRLRIGIQWQTQVTLDGCDHDVSQAYCSAVPVGYSTCSREHWAPFARLVLEAAYEATLCAAVLNFQASGNPVLFLTRVGGGVFGNDDAWIDDALMRALNRCRDAPLSVALVGRKSRPETRSFIEAFTARAGD